MVEGNKTHRRNPSVRLDCEVAELHRELRDSVQGQEKRMRQGDEDVLRWAESSVTQGIKSAMLEMQSSVLRLVDILNHSFKH